MSQFTNIRTVSVPSIGKLPLADNPGTFRPSGDQRQHKPGRLAEDGGFIVNSVPAVLELNINMVPGTDVTALNAIVDEDVTVRLSDGAVHMMPRAFRSGDPLSVADGQTKLTLTANTSERI